MPFESSMAGYVIFLGVPLMLVAAIGLSIVRNVAVRRLLFAALAVSWVGVVVLLVAWSLRTWPAWFLTAPVAAGLCWALWEGGRNAFGRPRA